MQEIESLHIRSPSIRIRTLFCKCLLWYNWFLPLTLSVTGLCPDWEDWDPKKAKANAKEAMDAAEQWLDVPQVSRCHRNKLGQGHKSLMFITRSLT